MIIQTAIDRFELTPDSTLEDAKRILSARHPGIDWLYSHYNGDLMIYVFDADVDQKTAETFIGKHVKNGRCES